MGEENPRYRVLVVDFATHEWTRVVKMRSKIFLPQVFWGWKFGKTSLNSTSLATNQQFLRTEFRPIFSLGYFCNKNINLGSQVSYFLGNFTPKTSNYCLENRALGFPGITNDSPLRTLDHVSHRSRWKIAIHRFQNLLKSGWPMLDKWKFQLDTKHHSKKMVDDYKALRRKTSKKNGKTR